MAMYRFWTLVLIAFLWVGCKDEKVAPSAACSDDSGQALTPDHPKRAAIQALMDRYTELGLPGMTVLISDDEGLWYGSAGYADIEGQVEMQPCHINKLGSVTKLMMATLAWQFIEAGELDLEAPIGAYIPEIAARISHGDRITVGMLINHTAGVPDIARDLDFNLAVINDFSRYWTAEQILTYIEGRPAVHAPGERLSYSNTHTLLIGLIIEAVSGRPHGELLQERLLTPLGMNRTLYYDFDGDFPSAAVAQGYLDFNNDGGAIQNISNLNPGNGWAFTGVYSTVMDLYRFMNALLREQTLIRPENIAFILANPRTSEDQSWQSSFGAIHNEFRDVLPDSIQSFGHAGGDIGYSANLSYLPHNNTIYAATFNYGTNLPTELGDRLGDLRDELILLMAE